MGESIFLAKAFGLYYLISGVAILLRSKEFKNMLDDFIKNTYHIYFVGLFLTIIGILLVLTHNVWEGGWVVIITVMSWLILFKGVVYLLLPRDMLKSQIKWLGEKNWYTIGGVISILIGLYLGSKGFGVL